MGFICGYRRDRVLELSAMYYPINYEYIKEIIASNEKEQYFYFEIIM